jgi:hypothetical protein
MLNKVVRTNYIWVSLNAKFDAEFESVVKTNTKKSPKKVIKLKTFAHRNISKKIPLFYRIFVMHEFFCNYFNGFEISIKLCVF